MVAPLHVGVVGAGRMGAFHVKTLRMLEGISNITLTDLDRARAARVARELEAAVVETPEALVEAGVDALVITTATPGHAPLAPSCCCGRPARFCEKPVALDLATINDVIADVERAGILVQIGFQRRFDVGYEAAHNAVATGALGSLLVLGPRLTIPSRPLRTSSRAPAASSATC